ncbi:antibiotic biosynthesis monooxygenase [Roseibium sp. SCPC15]|uniref:putative quinol monooxygenase n=1 Tax=Roseibium sp. SCP15 TaxID=3141376 RepID=UPI00333632BF
MSVWVTLEMTVRQGQYAKLELFLEEKLPAVRSFNGALSVSVFFDQASNRLLILEEWKSRQHHQSYFQSITENGVMPQLLSFMVAPPAVQYYDRVII